MCGQNNNKNDWLPTGTLNRFLKSDGVNLGENKGEIECGIKEIDEDKNRCKTINYSIGLIKEHGGFWINVLDNVIEDSSIRIEKELFVKLIGKTKDISISNSAYSSLFSVFGTLEISSFTLTSKDPSLFSVSSTGNVEITNLFIKGLFH